MGSTMILTKYTFCDLKNVLIFFFLIIGLGENEVLYMTNYGSKK